MMLRNKAIAVLVLFLIFGFVHCLREGFNAKRSVDKVLHLSNHEKYRKRRDVAKDFASIEKRASDSFCDSIKETIKKNNKTFVKEEHLPYSGKSLQIAWTGKQYEKIVALTSDGVNSTLYLSNSSISKTFQDISQNLNFKSNNVNIFKHPGDPEIVYLVDNDLSLMKTVLHISTDSSEKYTSVNLDFLMSTSPGLIFHGKKKEYIMAYGTLHKTLHLTKNKGFNWTLIDKNVISAKWSQNDAHSDDIFIITNDNPGSLFDFLLKTNPFDNILKKSDDFGKTWKILEKQVHSFGVEGNFIYASIYLNKNRDRILKVSTDSGLFWNRVRLPTVTPDMFFSILDLSNGLIFLHVDDPGDTGKGVLYTSDATGIVFSESMNNHLFPNYEDVTDFYPVLSMPGVFISSQLMSDNGIRTMITYNRGVEWQLIRRPEGIICTNENLPCSLQIHNAYSRRRGIVANPPLSVPEAKGIILAHAHVADSLQMSPPDVYVSRDGGHTWHFALKGPHHYQIADHGGLLVAVPADTTSPKTIKYSANAGRCWEEYNFTTEEIVFTGLLTEPSNTDSVVALWGYTEKDSIWHTYVFNFTDVITDKCAKKDYEEWEPLNHDNTTCFLGRQEKNFMVKKESWCLTGKISPHNITWLSCECTQEDYGCDYGYVKKDEKCVEDSSVKDVINICLRNHRESLVPLGYHKIPGDTCVGGFVPPKAKMIDLNIVCTDEVYLKNDFMTDKELDKLVSEKSMLRSRANKVIWTVVLITLIIICTVMLVWAGKKLNNKYRNMTFKYSSIKSTDDDLDYKIGAQSKLPQNTSLYDDVSSDEDDLEKPIRAPLSGSHNLSDELKTGFIHPKLYDLVTSGSSADNKASSKDEKLILYDSDVELLK